MNYHIINSIQRGGAEIQLLEYLKKTTTKNTIIILKNTNNDLEEAIRSLNIPVKQFGLQNFNILNLFKLWFFLISKKGSFYCWLYHSCFFSIPILLFKKKTYWLIHHADPNDYNFSFFLKKILPFLSVFSNFIPTKILFCSNSGMNNHIKFGFSKKKSKLVYNGYDFDYFNININKSKNKNNSIIKVGLVGRWHPVKDHKIMLKAVSAVDNIQLHLIGYGLTKENKELNNLISIYNIENRVVLSGLKENSFEIYQDLDFVFLTSRTEAFPNVMIESIASGIPFFSFDVGDISMHLPKKFIIKHRNLDSLINKLKSLKNESNELSSDFIEYFKKEFSIHRLVNKIDNL